MKYWGYREYWWPLHAVALASAGSALHAHEPRCAVDSGTAHSKQTGSDAGPWLNDWHDMLSCCGRARLGP